MAEGISYESVSDHLVLVEGSETWISLWTRSLALTREYCSGPREPWHNFLHTLGCFVISWLPDGVDPLCFVRTTLWVIFLLFACSLFVWFATRGERDNRYHSWLRRRIHKQD